jgi:hypothetical protein
LEENAARARTAGSATQVSGRGTAEGPANLLLDLDGLFNAADAARAVHQWVGTGGLLGYPSLSRGAREVETLLRERPLDAAQVRESLTNLLLVFDSPQEVIEAQVPEDILQALSGRRVALAGYLHPKPSGSASHWNTPARGPFFWTRITPTHSGSSKAATLPPSTFSLAARAPPGPIPRRRSQSRWFSSATEKKFLA